jgi:hypothetical protein
LHPLKADIQRQLYLDQSNISHRVNEFWWENNLLKGYVEAANTERGRDFDGLIRQKCKVAFSLRAIGPVVEKKSGYVIVKDPLTIFSFDWVIHPSHIPAYMDEIIVESANVGNTILESNSLFVPFFEEQALDYVKTSSKNLKIISEQLEFEINTASLSEDFKKVYLKDERGTCVVNLEDFVSREINDYLRKFK